MNVAGKNGLEQLINKRTRKMRPQPKQLKGQRNIKDFLASPQAKAAKEDDDRSSIYDSSDDTQEEEKEDSNFMLSVGKELCLWMKEDLLK